MDQDYISVTGSAGFDANANSVQDCPKHPMVSIPTLHFTFITLADVILVERGLLRACLTVSNQRTELHFSKEVLH